MTHRHRPFTAGLLLVAGSLLASTSSAHFGPIPLSLKGVAPPEVPGLLDGPDPIVVNKQAAIALGKALFWDMNVGSDGMACASCHFHAGADARTKNQIAPRGKHGSGVDLFDTSVSGRQLAPNAELRRSDFPLHQKSDPLDDVAPAIHDSDDIVSSAGSFGGIHQAVPWFDGSVDTCERSVDAVFHSGAIGTRSVEPRNAPTVINAVFNHRNLWDGSANNVFNGSSQWGDRDPDAGVWVRQDDGTVARERLQLPNSSLASQAIAPAISSVEMSCAGRRMADLGRKMLWRFPLAAQNVHWQDSVLGDYARSTPGNLQHGLKSSYFLLVMQAFASRYWAYWHNYGQFGAPPAIGKRNPYPYLMIEANFGMFFGLAIQLYESTLISDDSRFDRAPRGANGLPLVGGPDGLTQDEFDGMQEFRVAHCNTCHTGPNFTTAAIDANADLIEADPNVFGNAAGVGISFSRNVVTRHATNAAAAIVDTGFAGTGVTPDGSDPGVGGSDPWGNPLSFSDQYLQYLMGDPQGKVVDAGLDAIRPCDFDTALTLDSDAVFPGVFTHADGLLPQTQATTDCFNPTGAFLPTPAAAIAEFHRPDNLRMRSAANGSFKIPTLRNVELTGPYMHNGGMATLEQVMAFYTRGGNFETDAKQFGFVFPQAKLRFLPQVREKIILFMKTLTDERVKYARAPFDHPELRIPHGHVGDEFSVTGGNALGDPLAADEFLHVPAVGAAGRADALQAFDSLLAP